MRGMRRGTRPLGAMVLLMAMVMAVAVTSGCGRVGELERPAALAAASR